MTDSTSLPNGSGSSHTPPAQRSPPPDGARPEAGVAEKRPGGLGGRMQRLEGKAVDALHAIDGHNARELTADARGSARRMADWLGRKVRAFRGWYGAQPGFLKIVYGCTLVPAAAALALAGFLCVKFAAPILLMLLVGVKLSIVAVKVLFFTGYIGYKIVKTILIWYYIISRSHSGGKARRARAQAASAGAFDVVGAPGDAARAAPRELRFRTRWKNLHISDDAGREVRVLFSYLRYAMLGQKAMGRHLVKSWRAYLTPWDRQSRATVKSGLAPVGASIFTPHTLGPDLGNDRLLVLGDAELTRVEVGATRDLVLCFTVRWVAWEMKLRRQLKFLHVKRRHHSDRWQVNVAPLWEPARQPVDPAPGGSEAV